MVENEGPLEWLLRAGARKLSLREVLWQIALDETDDHIDVGNALHDYVQSHRRPSYVRARGSLSERHQQVLDQYVGTNLVFEPEGRTVELNIAGTSTSAYFAGVHTMHDDEIMGWLNEAVARHFGVSQYNDEYWLLSVVTSQDEAQRLLLAARAYVVLAVNGDLARLKQERDAFITQQRQALEPLLKAQSDALASHDEGLRQRLFDKSRYRGGGD